MADQQELTEDEAKRVLIGIVRESNNDASRLAAIKMLFPDMRLGEQPTGDPFAELDAGRDELAEARKRRPA